MPQNGVSKFCDHNISCVFRITITAVVNGEACYPKYQVGQWVQIGFLGRYGKIVGVALQANVPQFCEDHWTGQYHKPRFEYQVQETGDFEGWIGFYDSETNDFQLVTDSGLELELERERWQRLQEISHCSCGCHLPD